MQPNYPQQPGYQGYYQQPPPPQYYSQPPARPPAPPADISIGAIIRATLIFWLTLFHWGVVIHTVLPTQLADITWVLMFVAQCAYYCLTIAIGRTVSGWLAQIQGSVMRRAWAATIAMILLLFFINQVGLPAFIVGVPAVSN
jgi:hypothetical protein